MDITLLKAIYETKREQLILAVKNPALSGHVNLAYVYAHESRMAPYFHIQKDDDPFVGAYNISWDFVSEVIEYADKEWLAGNVYEFYEYEHQFGGDKRCELIAIFRYTFNSRKFDAAFFKKLVSNAPVEANDINQSLTPDDIYLI